MTARGPAAIFLLVAGVLLVQVRPLERWTAQGPGEGFFPLLLTGALALLAAIQLVGRGRPRGPWTTPEGVVSGADRTAFLVYVGATVAFALVFMRLGLLLSVALFMLVTVRFAERRGWARAGLAGALSALALYVVFGRLLGVPFPAGPIENVLRAAGLLR